MSAGARRAGAQSAPDFDRLLREARRTFANFGSLPLIAGAAGFLAYGLGQSVYFVPGGCAAVKFNALTGLQNHAYSEGVNFAIPFLETPIVFEIRYRPVEISSSSGSRDLQIINTSVRVLYKPKWGELPQLYRELGVHFAAVVTPSIVNEVVKSVIAQYNASDLLVKRQEVSTHIARALRQRAGMFHMEISDVSITQMTFGKEYMAAVEAKQVAQQMAERAKFFVDKAKQEKEGNIILARGEAEAARMIGEAMSKSPGFIKLRRIETAKAVAKALSSSNSQHYIDADTLILKPKD